ncbi:hypothetical protein ABXV18_24995 [Vibrio owensii]|uniref:hypothetical protein n=1 Tax=Vibrio owensii TaxID=696485 RepID=UPI00339A7BD0
MTQGTKQSLSVQTIIEKNKLASTVPFLIMLEVDVIDKQTGNIVSQIYVVRNSDDVRYKNRVYVAVDFEISFKSAEGEQASVSLNIKDYKRSFQSVMQQYAGGVGSVVRLMVVNAAALDKDPDILETFQIVSASARNYEVSWTLGSVDLLSVRTPKRRQMRNRCAWQYKSKECGYKGSLPRCDLSLNGSNGCSVHQNENNYGGFPGITNQ